MITLVLGTGEFLSSPQEGVDYHDPGGEEREKVWCPGTQLLGGIARDKVGHPTYTIKKASWLIYFRCSVKESNTLLRISK